MVLVATASEVTENVPVVAPAAIVVVAGTVAADVLLEVSVTGNPAAGAGLLSVMVATEAVPPVTEAGFSESPVIVGAVIARDAVEVALFAVAEIVAVALAPTATVVTENVAEVAPAATLTVAGTVAAALFEARVTVRPPAGAALLIVTVPVELFPPTKLVGFNERAVIAGGVTVIVPVALFEPVVAVTVTDVDERTALVVAVNVAVVAPAATLTEAGTTTAALFEARVTVVVLPAATGPFSVTVPVDDVPPATVEGLRATVLM